jgi:outer membrane protein
MRHLLVLAALAALLGLGLPALVTAQQTPQSSVAYVDSEAILAAYPAARPYLDARRAGTEEMNRLGQELQVLAQRIQTGTATAQQRQQYDILSQTFQRRQEQIRVDLRRRLEEISPRIDQAISAVARQRGHTMVLDAIVAQQTGLILYASDSIDITQAVIDALN